MSDLGQEGQRVGLAKGFDVVLECTIRWKCLFFKNQQPISVGIWGRWPESLVRCLGVSCRQRAKEIPLMLTQNMIYQVSFDESLQRLN